MRRGLNSRFVRLMRTGPVDGLPIVGGGGGPQGQGQQQDGGQQGAGGGGPPADQQGQQGQQQGQGDPFGGLLDQARQQGGQADDQQQNQGTGQQQNPPTGPQSWEQMQRWFQSELDRRINAANNPGGGRGRQQQNDRQQQGQQNDGQQQPVARVDQGARREARLAFREYVGDEIKFLSPVERAAANQIGTAMIATWDGDGDADQFGRHVAGQVAATVRDLGEMYKRTTIDALRKQGLLKDQPQGPGAGSALAGFPPPTGGTGFVLPTNGGGIPQKNPQAAIQSAVAMADQYNQRAGYVKQQ